MTLALATPASAHPSIQPVVVPLHTLVAMARGLAAGARRDHPGLDLSAPDRQGVRMLARESYEAWLLAWPPGSVIEPHDHGDSHGAFAVFEGSLLETRWRKERRRQRTLTAFEAAAVPVGVVHGVANEGSVTALSVHVYSLPLSEMRFFEDDATTVVRVETVDQVDRG